MDANTIGNQSTEGSSINQHLGKHPNSLGRDFYFRNKNDV